MKAFPYKVLEYAASGLPIVMTNVSAVASIVKMWRAGFVHPENDIEGIATNIIELMISDYLWKDYSARATEMASLFDVKRLAYKEVQILSSLIS
jgi:glycosyltransferase involved in cell wall biosynthesis